MQLRKCLKNGRTCLLICSAKWCRFQPLLLVTGDKAWTSEDLGKIERSSSECRREMVLGKKARPRFLNFRLCMLLFFTIASQHLAEKSMHARRLELTLQEQGAITKTQSFPKYEMKHLKRVWSSLGRSRLVQDDLWAAGKNYAPIRLLVVHVAEIFLLWFFSASLSPPWRCRLIGNNLTRYIFVFTRSGCGETCEGKSGQRIGCRIVNDDSTNAQHSTKRCCSHWTLFFTRKEGQNLIIFPSNLARSDLLIDRRILTNIHNGTAVGLHAPRRSSGRSGKTSPGRGKKQKFRHSWDGFMINKNLSGLKCFLLS